jgi:hypothetical protein
MRSRKTPPIFRNAKAWVTRRSPRWILVAGWIVFMLCAYPGYLSFDSVAQFTEVRTGVFSDAYPPVMSQLWSVCEYVIAGPASMLAIQGGLFVIGCHALLARVIARRVAAVLAIALLLWPPIFSPLSVVWPHSMMSAALAAAAGAFATRDRRWFPAGCAAIVLAVSCRSQAAVAALPLVGLAISGPFVRKLALAIGVVVGCLGVAGLVAAVSIDRDTYTSQQLEAIDLIGTLRRAHADPALLGGLAAGDPSTLARRLSASRDAFDWSPLASGDDRVIDPVATDDASRELRAAWLAAIGRYPSAYVAHRFAMTKRLLAVGGRWQPVYEGFGETAQLHHRATPSDVELGMQWIVEHLGRTVLFRPWLYVLLGAIALGLAWRVAELRALAASALLLELALALTAISTEYRNSHWLVAATTAVLATALARRRVEWRAS